MNKIFLKYSSILLFWSFNGGNEKFIPLFGGENGMGRREHSFLSISLRPRLGGENGMEWKGMERIILEYSSLPLFESFDGQNEKFIPLFGSLSGRERNR